MNIDSDTMKHLVAKAILESIDGPAREKLLSDAIAGLMTQVEQTSGYNRDTRTHIQRIFDNSVSYAANQIVRKLLDDEYADRLRALLRTALDKAFADSDRMDKVAIKVADAIGEGLSGR